MCIRDNASAQIRISLTTTCLVALALAPASAAQGDEHWSDEYDRPGLTGRVFGLHTYNGALYAGGAGFASDGVDLGALARFDGQRWQPVGNGVSSTPSFGALRRVVDAFADFGGELVVAGEFIGAGGLQLDGLASWDGTQWSSLQVGPGMTYELTGTVYDLEVFQGELWAAGEFDFTDTTTNQTWRSIAVWNGSTWRAPGGGLSGPFATNVRALLATPTALVIGGTFTTVGGVAANGIASWNGSAWSALGSGASGGVHSLALYQGDVMAGGAFHSIGGVPALKIARWNGAVWSALGSGIPDTYITTTVDTLAVFGPDLYLGGTFAEVNGVPALNVARWDGAAMHSIGGLFGTGDTPQVLAATIWQSRLVLGGEFSRASATPVEVVGQSLVSESAVTWNGTQWGQLGHGLGFDTDVRDVVHYGNGMVAVGRFREAGSTYTSTVAYFDGADWRSLGAISGQVMDAEIFQGDLVVIGSITSAGGVSASNVARYDGASWHAMGTGAPDWTLAVYQGQLYAGGIGPPKRWNGATWVTFGEPLYGQTNDMHVHNGLLYIGGQFNVFGGPGPHLATWDGVALASVGANGTVEVLETFGSDLVVGGTMSQVAGVATGPLARLSGSTWSSFGGVTGTSVLDLEVMRGQLFASGDLIQGANDPRDYVARWDGSGWVALGSGLGGTPLAMLADDVRGRIYMGGIFHHAGHKPSFYFARWDEHVGTNLGQTTCTGVPNSTGSAGTMSAFGSPLTAVNDLRLTASGLPLSAFGYFITARTPGFVVGPGGSQGNLCLGASIGRFALQVQNTGTSGRIEIEADLTAFPHPAFGSVPVNAGETWHFQAWHRDSVGGLATSNFTGGLSIAFQ
jgi:hypothetical protein